MSDRSTPNDNPPPAPARFRYFCFGIVFALGMLGLIQDFAGRGAVMPDETSPAPIIADNGKVYVVRVCDEPCCIVVEVFREPGDENEPIQVIDVPIDVAPVVAKALFNLSRTIEVDDE